MKGCSNGLDASNEADWLDASEAEPTSTAQRGAVLLAQHAAAADRAQQRRTRATRQKKQKATNSKEAAAPKERCAFSRRTPHFSFVYSNKMCTLVLVQR